MASVTPKPRDSAVLREQLLKHLGETLEENLVVECINVCQIFNIDGDDFSFKYESMIFGTTGPKIFTADSVKAVKAQLQSDLAKKEAKKQQAKAQLGGALSKNLFAGLRIPNARFGSGVAKTMPVPRHDGFGMTSGELKMPIAGPSKVVFVGPSKDQASRKDRAYRYMYEKVSERSEVLDDRIDNFGELVKEHYKIDELGDPSAFTEDEIVAVGRITSDFESSGPSKLNEASLALESSRMMASGARVPLRFDPGVKVRQGTQGMEGVGLFPGAIVALKGKNGGGGWFSVTEILSLPSLKAPVKSETRGDSFSMYIACGPYTPDADLKYKPWTNLLSKLKSDMPAVVLLTGPFVDCTHSLVKNGDVDESPADLFREQFLTPLHDFLAVSPESIVLIVPSVRDMISDHAVFPQCEFSQEFSADPRIHLLPNPARFSLNGVSFGVSSLDVVFHLRKEEFVKRAQEVDPRPTDGDATQVDTMTNTCRHLLQQRSFYPIFPVPLDLSHEVNLDISHSRGLDLCGEGAAADCAPAVLVIPSKLKHFSKVVDSTIVVNPSFLTKGTYATLTYTGAGEEMVLRDRFKMDIIRLDPRP